MADRNPARALSVVERIEAMCDFLGGSVSKKIESISHLIYPSRAASATAAFHSASERPFPLRLDPEFQFGLQEHALDELGAANGFLPSIGVSGKGANRRCNLVRAKVTIKPLLGKPVLSIALAQGSPNVE